MKYSYSLGRKEKKTKSCYKRSKREKNITSTEDAGVTKYYRRLINGQIFRYYSLKNLLRQRAPSFQRGEKSIDAFTIWETSSGSPTVESLIIVLQKHTAQLSSVDLLGVILRSVISGDRIRYPWGCLGRFFPSFLQHHDASLWTSSTTARHCTLWCSRVSTTENRTDLN